MSTPVPISADELKNSLPDKLRKSVTDELLVEVNDLISNPEAYEYYRDNLLSYSKILLEGKFSLSQYISAIKYVSFKHMDMTNLEAYSKTFPDKMQRFAAQGVQAKDISSYVFAYNKSKLVQLIMGQSMIPSWILNQDLFQKALNVQAELMVTANSEKVRSDAANSLLTHLKPPEVKKVELDIGVKEDSSIKQLRETTMALAAQQRMLIQSGVSNAQEIAHSEIIKKDAIDVEAKEV